MITTGFTYYDVLSTKFPIEHQIQSIGQGLMINSAGHDVDDADDNVQHLTCSASHRKDQPRCLYCSTTVCEQAVHWLKACPVRHIWENPLSWPLTMWGTGPRGSSSWSTCWPATAAGAWMPRGCCSVHAISSTATAPVPTSHPSLVMLYIVHSFGS